MTAHEVFAFAGQQFLGGVPLAKMSEQGIEGRTAWARFVGGAPVVKAEFAATKDSGSWQKREWTIVDAKFDPATGRVSAELPDGLTAYYFMPRGRPRLRRVERAR